MTLVEITSIIGIMFFGYFIGRIIEAIWIGSFSKPKEKEKK